MNARRFPPLTLLARARRLCIDALVPLTAAAALAGLCTPASAQSYETRYLYAKSQCRYPLRLLVHHRDSGNPHHTHAWYVLDPYEGIRLEDRNVTLRQIVGEDLYAFAETVGANSPAMQWAGSDQSTSFDGVYYRLFRARLFVNQNGDLQVTLRCD